MSDNIDIMGHLPTGWETRYELRNRGQYYADTNNKVITQWEEQRPRYKSLFQQGYYASPSRSSQQDANVLQHGPLEFHGYNAIYPSYSSFPPPPQPAFQILSTPFSYLAPNTTLCKEFTEPSRPSTILNRALGTVMGATAVQQRNHHHIDSSLFANTDELVAKIGATFPTVSETHIRCLLKKYHNREAVVISALQVEKHPIATPGPFSTPPLGRNCYLPGNYTPFQVTPPVSIRGTPSISIRSNMATPPVTIRGSVGTPPLGIRGSPLTRGSSPITRPNSGSSYYSFPTYGDSKQSPRSQTSPKMKLRYLKSIFPKVEEVVLLDTLTSENNNVAKTAEKLKFMGFEKKDGSKSLEKKRQEQSAVVKTVQSLIKKEEVETQKPKPPPRLKSLEEKSKMKVRLAGLYSDIPEKLIQIAIESVDFDEEKARHLLMLLVNEENESKEASATRATTKSLDGVSKTAKDSKSKEMQSGKKGEETRKEGSEKKSKPKKEVPKISRGTSTTEDKEFKSPYLTKAKGRNKELRKGPNDQLLLADYLTWNGPNPELRGGRNKGLAEGPNKNLLIENNKIAKGPNKENRKGPTLSLAKGSIYSRIAMSFFGDSRGQ